MSQEFSNLKFNIDADRAVNSLEKITKLLADIGDDSKNATNKMKQDFQEISSNIEKLHSDTDAMIKNLSDLKSFNVDVTIDTDEITQKITDSITGGFEQATEDIKGNISKLVNTYADLAQGIQKISKQQGKMAKVNSDVAKSTEAINSATASPVQIEVDPQESAKAFNALLNQYKGMITNISRLSEISATQKDSEYAITLSADQALKTANDVVKQYNSISDTMKNSSVDDFFPDGSKEKIEDQANVIRQYISLFKELNAQKERYNSGFINIHQYTSNIIDVLTAIQKNKPQEISNVLEGVDEIKIKELPKQKKIKKKDLLPKKVESLPEQPEINNAEGLRDLTAFIKVASSASSKIKEFASGLKATGNALAKFKLKKEQTDAFDKLLKPVNTNGKTFIDYFISTGNNVSSVTGSVLNNIKSFNDAMGSIKLAPVAPATSEWENIGKTLTVNFDVLAQTIDSKKSIIHEKLQNFWKATIDAQESKQDPNATKSESDKPKSKSRTKEKQILDLSDSSFNRIIEDIKVMIEAKKGLNDALNGLDKIAFEALPSILTTEQVDAFKKSLANIVSLQGTTKQILTSDNSLLGIAENLKNVKNSLGLVVTAMQELSAFSKGLSKGHKITLPKIELKFSKDTKLSVDATSIGCINSQDNPVDVDVPIYIRPTQILIQDLSAEKDSIKFSDTITKSLLDVLGKVAFPIQKPVKLIAPIEIVPPEKGGFTINEKAIAAMASQVLKERFEAERNASKKKVKVGAEVSVTPLEAEDSKTKKTKKTSVSTKTPTEPIKVQAKVASLSAMGIKLDEDSIIKLIDAHAETFKIQKNITVKAPITIVPSDSITIPQTSVNNFLKDPKNIVTINKSIIASAPISLKATDVSVSSQSVTSIIKEKEKTGSLYTRVTANGNVKSVILKALDVSFDEGTINAILDSKPIELRKNVSASVETVTIFPQKVSLDQKTIIAKILAETSANGGLKLATLINADAKFRIKPDTENQNTITVDKTALEERIKNMPSVKITTPVNVETSMVIQPKAKNGLSANITAEELTALQSSKNALKINTPLHVTAPVIIEPLGLPKINQQAISNAIASIQEDEKLNKTELVLTAPVSVKADIVLLPKKNNIKLGEEALRTIEQTRQNIKNPIKAIASIEIDIKDTNSISIAPRYIGMLRNYKEKLDTPITVTAPIDIVPINERIVLADGSTKIISETSHRIAEPVKVASPIDIVVKDDASIKLHSSIANTIASKVFEANRFVNVKAPINIVKKDDVIILSQEARQAIPKASFAINESVNVSSPINITPIKDKISVDKNAVSVIASSEPAKTNVPFTVKAPVKVLPLHTQIDSNAKPLIEEGISQLKPLGMKTPIVVTAPIEARIKDKGSIIVKQKELKQQVSSIIQKMDAIDIHEPVKVNVPIAINGINKNQTVQITAMSEAIEKLAKSMKKLDETKMTDSFRVLSETLKNIGNIKLDGLSEREEVLSKISESISSFGSASKDISDVLKNEKVSAPETSLSKEEVSVEVKPVITTKETKDAVEQVEIDLAKESEEIEEEIPTLEMNSGDFPHLEDIFDRMNEASKEVKENMDESSRADFNKNIDELNAAEKDYRKFEEDSAKEQQKTEKEVYDIREKINRQMQGNVKHNENIRKILDQNKKILFDSSKQIDYLNSKLSKTALIKPLNVKDQLAEMKAVVQLQKSTTITDTLNMAGFTLNATTFTNKIRESIRTANEFGLEIRKIQSLATDFNFNKLSTALMDLDARFGNVIHNAQALYWAYSSGVRGTEQQLAEFTEKMSKTAITIGADVMPTVDAATTLMNAYNLSVEEANKVSDLLFTIVKEGKANAGQLTSALGNVVATASSLGVELHELGAAAATLTKTMKTNKALTYLNNILGKMISPTQDVKDAAAEMGIEFSLSAIKAKGFSAVMREIRDVTGGSAEQIAKLFPDLRGQRAALSLLTTQYEDFERELEIFRNNSGATEEALGKITNTPEKNMMALKNMYAIISIEMGRNIIQALTFGGTLDKIIEAINSMSKASKGTIGVLGSFGVTLGATIMLQKAFTVASFMYTQGMVNMNQQIIAQSKANLENAVASQKNAIAQQEIAIAERKAQLAENKSNPRLIALEEAIKRQREILSNEKQNLNLLKQQEAVRKMLSNQELQTSLETLAKQRLQMATIQKQFRLQEASVTFFDKTKQPIESASSYSPQALQQIQEVITTTQQRTIDAQQRFLDLAASTSNHLFVDKLKKNLNQYFRFEMARIRNEEQYQNKEISAAKYLENQGLYEKAQRSIVSDIRSQQRANDEAVQLNLLEEEGLKLMQKKASVAMQLLNSYKLGNNPLAYQVILLNDANKLKEISMSIQNAQNQLLRASTGITAQQVNDYIESQAAVDNVTASLSRMNAEKIALQSELGLLFGDKSIEHSQRILDLEKKQLEVNTNNAEILGKNASLAVSNATVDSTRKGRQEALRQEILLSENAMKIQADAEHVATIMNQNAIAQRVAGVQSQIEAQKILLGELQAESAEYQKIQANIASLNAELKKVSPSVSVQARLGSLRTYEASLKGNLKQSFSNINVIQNADVEVDALQAKALRIQSLINSNNAIMKQFDSQYEVRINNIVDEITELEKQRTKILTKYNAIIPKTGNKHTLKRLLQEKEQELSSIDAQIKEKREAYTSERLEQGLLPDSYKDRQKQLEEEQNTILQKRNVILQDLFKKNIEISNLDDFSKRKNEEILRYEQTRIDLMRTRLELQTIENQQSASNASKQAFDARMNAKSDPFKHETETYQQAWLQKQDNKNMLDMVLMPQKKQIEENIKSLKKDLNNPIYKQQEAQAKIRAEIEEQTTNLAKTNNEIAKTKLNIATQEANLESVINDERKKGIGIMEASKYALAKNPAGAFGTSLNMALMSSFGPAGGFLMGINVIGKFQTAFAALNASILKGVFATKSMRIMGMLPLTASAAQVASTLFSVNMSFANLKAMGLALVGVNSTVVTSEGKVLSARAALIAMSSGIAVAGAAALTAGLIMKNLGEDKIPTVFKNIANWVYDINKKINRSEILDEMDKTMTEQQKRQREELNLAEKRNAIDKTSMEQLEKELKLAINNNKSDSERIIIQNKLNKASEKYNKSLALLNNLLNRSSIEQMSLYNLAKEESMNMNEVDTYNILRQEKRAIDSKNNASYQEYYNSIQNLQQHVMDMDSTIKTHQAIASIEARNFAEEIALENESFWLAEESADKKLELSKKKLDISRKNLKAILKNEERNGKNDITIAQNMIERLKEQESKMYLNYQILLGRRMQMELKWNGSEDLKNSPEYKRLQSDINKAEREHKDAQEALSKARENITSTFNSINQLVKEVIDNGINVVLDSIKQREEKLKLESKYNGDDDMLMNNINNLTELKTAMYDQITKITDVLDSSTFSKDISSPIKQQVIKLQKHEKAMIKYQESVSALKKYRMALDISNMENGNESDESNRIKKQIEIQEKIVAEAKKSLSSTEKEITGIDFLALTNPENINSAINDKMKKEIDSYKTQLEKSKTEAEKTSQIVEDIKFLQEYSMMQKTISARSKETAKAQKELSEVTQTSDRTIKELIEDQEELKAKLKAAQKREESAIETLNKNKEKHDAIVKRLGESGIYVSGESLNSLYKINFENLNNLIEQQQKDKQVYETAVSKLGEVRQLSSASQKFHEEYRGMLMRAIDAYDKAISDVNSAMSQVVSESQRLEKETWERKLSNPQDFNMILTDAVNQRLQILDQQQRTEQERQTKLTKELIKKQGSPLAQVEIGKKLFETNSSITKIESERINVLKKLEEQEKKHNQESINFAMKLNNTWKETIVKPIEANSSESLALESRSFESDRIAPDVTVTYQNEIKRLLTENTQRQLERNNFLKSQFAIANQILQHQAVQLKNVFGNAPKTFSEATVEFGHQVKRFGDNVKSIRTSTAETSVDPMQ